MRCFPAPGLVVKDPRTGRVIGPEGVEVGPHDLDLNRMLDQGDLRESAAAAPIAAPAPVGAPAKPVDGASQ